MKDAYEHTNTRGKVSMNNKKEYVDEDFKSIEESNNVKAVFKNVGESIGWCNARIDYLNMKGIERLLVVMKNDPTYERRAHVSDNFTVQFCTSMRSKGEEDPDYLGKTEIGKRTLYKYKFDANKDGITLSQWETEWNSTAYAEEELYKEILAERQRIAAEKRAAEEAEKRAKDEKIAMQSSMLQKMADAMGITLEQAIAQFGTM